MCGVANIFACLPICLLWWVSKKRQSIGKPYLCICQIGKYGNNFEYSLHTWLIRTTKASSTYWADTWPNSWRHRCGWGSWSSSGAWLRDGPSIGPLSVRCRFLGTDQRVLARIMAQRPHIGHNRCQHFHEKLSYAFINYRLLGGIWSKTNLCPLAPSIIISFYYLNQFKSS